MRRGFTIIALMICYMGMAQQQTSFQYLFNPLPYNPAAAGFLDVFSASAQFRFQSLGLPGAPTTQSLTLHSPFTNRQAAGGLQLWNSELGVQRHYGAFGAFAYKVDTENIRISLGISGGVNHYNTDLSSLNTRQPDDPAFSQTLNQWSPNFGTGVLIKGRKLFLGLSIPSLIENDDALNASRQLIGMAGYSIIKKDDGLEIQPHLFYRMSGGAMQEMIAGINFNYRAVVGLGLFYSLNEQVASVLHMNVTDQLRIAYSYEALLNQSDIAFVGSHEVGIHYLFNLPQRNKVSPRYF